MSYLSFEDLVKNKYKGLCLYGTVPPRKCTSIERVKVFAKKLVEDIERLGVDALVIYDVQDEPSRSGECRPFPFAQSHEPEVYAKIVKEYTTRPLECIIYRALPYISREQFQEFLEYVKNQAKCNTIALVGGPANYSGLSVIEAAELAHQASYNFCVGGITLAERHRDRGNEDEIVATKVENGLQFFTSQVVYNADNAISFLRDYDELCKRENRVPGRIIFTFAPFARQETADFLGWLGVELPFGTVKRVLSRGTPKARVDEAVEICRENLKRILDACERYGIDVPIGFNAECVSKHKEEIDGALELFAVFKDELDLYTTRRRVESRGRFNGR
jgi:hypothetical protein